MAAGSRDTPLDHRRTFLTLEGLRGVSALAIVFWHLGGARPSLSSHAYLAVDLFFLMSGVVIAHAYEKRLRDGWRFRLFVAARTKRLAPLYFAGLMLGAACSLIAHRLGYGGDGSVALNFALGLAFIPALLGGGDLYPLNAPCWSLLDEALANLAYAAVAPTLSDRTLKIIVGLGLTSLCLVVSRSATAANLGVTAENWIGGLARVSFSFPLGVLLQRLHARGQLTVWRAPAPLLLACAIASFLWPSDGPFYDLAMIVGLYPILIVLALSTEPKRRATVRVFTVAGLASYPLYVLHYPLAHLVSAIVPGDRATAALATLGCAMACLALAYVADIYFDRPLQAWLKRARPQAIAA